MTDAREIISQEFRQAHRDTCYPDASDDECEIAASVIVASLTAAGFRILGPDEVDPVTVEKCASIADADGRRELSWAEMSLPVSPGPVIAKDRAAVSDRIAAAIRALGRKA